MAKTDVAHFRKKMGLTQSELAQKLNVTRQTVSGWETGRTEPDIESMLRMTEIFSTDMNKLTGFCGETSSEIKKPPLKVMLAASAVISVIYEVYALLFSDTEGDIAAALPIMLLCSVMVVIMLAHVAKSGDFTMLAGYDPKISYNEAEIKKMLYSICMSISVGTLAFVSIYSLSMAFRPDIRLCVIIILAYILDLLFSILIPVRKYSGKVYSNDEDAVRETNKDKSFRPVSLPYVVFIVTQSLLLPLRCAFNQNASHLIACAVCFGCFAAETIWFLYEYSRQSSCGKDSYSPRKTLRRVMIIIGAICSVLILIA